MKVVQSGNKDFYHYCDERGTYYFDSHGFAILFATDDLWAIGEDDHKPAEYTGNDAAPEELTYKLYALALSKIRG